LIESGSDEELEALLRRELMEIASINGLDGEQIVQTILSDNGLDLCAQLTLGSERWPRPLLPAQRMPPYH
jgi:hypothetical protein